MDKLSEAICFATSAFDGQTRKCERYPAILHSLEAATIAQTLTDEPEVIISAVLHDTVEDAGISIKEIEDKFGARVAFLVASETENKREMLPPENSWQVRKQESIDYLNKTEDLGVKVLYLSDKLSNIRSLYRSKQKFGNDLWGMFNQKDPKKHKWYYVSIANAIKELQDTNAYTEYVALIEKTFSEK